MSFLRGCNRFLTSNAVWTVWLLGTSLAYCCVFLIWLWVMFLHSPSEIVLVPPAPSDLVSGFLPRLWMLFLFSLPELLCGRVEDCIQFVELVNSNFSIAVFNFPLSAAVSRCAVCTTASSGVTFGCLMYL